MAKRHVYAKDVTGYGEFIYVDLLPDVKRARQFNVNVIMSLLFAIVLAFFLIYIPYRDNTFTLEQLISENNDNIWEYQLTDEEFQGYEINIEAITFEQDIERMELLQLDLNNLMDTITLLVNDRDGRIQEVEYTSDADTIVVEVALIQDSRYSSINDSLLSQPFVLESEFSTPVQNGDNLEYTASFTIKVNYNAE